MTTNRITGTVFGNITLTTSGNYTSPLTVTSTAAVTGTVFVDNGETVINYGQLNTGGNAYGVSFSAGGAITNQVGGTISGGTLGFGAAIEARASARPTDDGGQFR
jgi:hypothetical protein